MRIVALRTQPSVIDQIRIHLRTRAAPPIHAGARSPPSTRASASRGTSRAPRPRPPPPRPSREYASPTPRSPGGPSARATVPPRRQRSPGRPRITRPGRRPSGPRGTPAPWRARRRPRTAARERQGTGAYTQRTPIENPIPRPVSLVWSSTAARRAGPRSVAFLQSGRACRTSRLGRCDRGLTGGSGSSTPARRE